MPAGRATEPQLQEYHGGEGEGGLAGVVASLAVAVGSLRESVDKQRGQRKPVIPWAACHPVPIAADFGAAGTVDQPDLYGPKDPYWWDLRSLGVWGFTAATVQVFLNSTSGQQIASTTTPGEFDWSANRLLAPRDRLIFVVSGLTGAVHIAGQAIEVETSWLPEYLL